MCQIKKPMLAGKCGRSTERKGYLLKNKRFEDVEAVALDTESSATLEKAMEELHFSARAYDRILKVARTNHKPSAPACGRQAGTALGLNRSSGSMFTYSPPAILHPPRPSQPRAASRHEVCDLCALAADEHIRQRHLYEAISYRILDRTLWT